MGANVNPAGAVAVAAIGGAFGGGNEFNPHQAANRAAKKMNRLEQRFGLDLEIAIHGPRGDIYLSNVESDEAVSPLMVDLDLPRWNRRNRRQAGRQAVADIESQLDRGLNRRERRNVRRAVRQSIRAANHLKKKGYDKHKGEGTAVFLPAGVDTLG